MKREMQTEWAWGLARGRSSSDIHICKWDHQKALRMLHCGDGKLQRLCLLYKPKSTKSNPLNRQLRFQGAHCLKAPPLFWVHVNLDDKQHLTKTLIKSISFLGKRISHCFVYTIKNVIQCRTLLIKMCLKPYFLQILISRLTCWSDLTICNPHKSLMPY